MPVNPGATLNESPTLWVWKPTNMTAMELRVKDGQLWEYDGETPVRVHEATGTAKAKKEYRDLTGIRVVPGIKASRGNEVGAKVTEVNGERQVTVGAFFLSDGSGTAPKGTPIISGGTTFRSQAELDAYIGVLSNLKSFLPK